MKKLKLSLEALQVDTFRPVHEQPSLQGTVRANSGCCYAGEPNHTEYYSTCPGTNAGASCGQCASGGGCLNTGASKYTVEESYCVCSDAYSCDCGFSEASNCHRCTGP